ncbi:hypothetical protein ACFO26_05875 [Lactococcus nasutitermitis]|uniref:Uncharacterized protein n=1 Tax=Lactococcus nasutitermitis TaxID=1652957 RepID=A0ABV9JET1_9LACT|nr:hypothetical protein [Lactococcus nasutitermitis]
MVLLKGKHLLVNNIQNVVLSIPLDSGNTNDYAESTTASSSTNSLVTKPTDNVVITGSGLTSSSTTKQKTGGTN